MTTRSKQRLVKDPRVEAWLEDKAVPYIYIPGPLQVSMFDKAKSLANQARTNKLVDSRLEEYVEARKRGDVFPAVVAAAASDGAKLVVVDGNHRLVSAEQAGTPIEGVYLIKLPPSDQRIVMMTFEANAKHGLPSSEEDRVNQAIYLIDSGATEPQAAAALNVSRNLLRKHLVRVRADRRADEVRIPLNEWEPIGGSVRQKLLAISTDEGFKAAAKLVYKARLSLAEVDSLVKDVNASKSASRQQGVVKQLTAEVYDERISETSGGTLGGVGSRRQMSARQRVNMVLGSVFTMPDFGATVTQIPPLEREDVSRRAREAGERLIELADKLSV